MDNEQWVKERAIRLLHEQINYSPRLLRAVRDFGLEAIERGEKQGINAVIDPVAAYRYGRQSVIDQLENPDEEFVNKLCASPEFAMYRAQRYVVADMLHVLATKLKEK